MAYYVEVCDRIFTPVEEVFDAIINPTKLSGYFVSRSSDRIKSGNTVLWEFKDYNTILEVNILDVEINKSIEFRWKASGKDTFVEILLDEIGKSTTGIIIKEKEFDYEENDTKLALQQTQGWTDFICSLKAFLYTGINLRTGK